VHKNAQFEEKQAVKGEPAPGFLRMSLVLGKVQGMVAERQVRQAEPRCHIGRKILGALLRKAFKGPPHMLAQRLLAQSGGQAVDGHDTVHVQLSGGRTRLLERRLGELRAIK
jgi:hypothetical protein